MPHPISLAPSARLAAALLLTLSAPLAAFAQAPADTAPEPIAAAERNGTRVERITVEDGQTRVDEVRVGGQTRSIEVTPKSGAPAYEIAPAPGGADLSDNGAPSGSAGKSRWRVLSF